MSDRIRKKLISEALECDWMMLEQHHARGALFVVEKSLNLFDVGVAIAQDDVTSVKVWQAQEKLRTPTDEEVCSWKARPQLKMAKFIILRPYVLIQKK